MNGEGYSELQMDNSLRTSAGLTLTPFKKVFFRLYGDYSRPSGITQYTLVGFAGFKNDLLTIGGEVSYKSNLDKISGHNAWGISGTGGITVAKKTELFMRYDLSASVIPTGETTQWNNLLDGRFKIVGIQYTFSQNVKMALNYQGTRPYSGSKQETDAIYINALFKF
jgi:hypothetical protein